MHNRRDFFKTIAGAAAGTFVVGHGIVGAQAPPARRQVMIWRPPRARDRCPRALRNAARRPVTVDLILNAPFLNNAEKEQILSGNLMKLLRIAS